MELTMRSASALRFSKGCSSLNLDRMVMVSTGGAVRGEEGGGGIVWGEEGGKRRSGGGCWSCG